MLAFPITHDSGRIILLFHWMMSALLGAVVIYKFHRNLVLAAGAFAVVTAQASVLAGGPGHPQQLVLMLLVGSILICAWISPGRIAFGLSVLGAIASALVFTKINVGAFYLLALGHSFICLLPSSTFRTISVTAMLILSLVLPFALMHEIYGKMLDMARWRRFLRRSSSRAALY